MQRILVLALGVLIVACSPPQASAPTCAPAATPSSAPADAQRATAAIVALYQPYLREGGQAPAWYQAMAMTPELAALVERDQRAAQGEVGAIDADPIIAAQDYQITDFSVAPDAPAA